MCCSALVNRKQKGSSVIHSNMDILKWNVQYTYFELKGNLAKSRLLNTRGAGNIDPTQPLKNSSTYRRRYIGMLSASYHGDHGFKSRFMLLFIGCLRDKGIVPIWICSDTWWMYSLIQRYEPSIGLVHEPLIGSGCRALYYSYCIM